MVSLSFVYSAALAIAAVSAQSSAPTLEDKAQDRIVGFASRQIVRLLTQIKNPDVPAGQASSEAQHFVTEIIDYPGFRSIIEQAENEDFSKNNDYELGASYLAEISKAYDEWSKGPSFAPYTSYFKAHASDFDIQRGINSAKITAKEFYPLVSKPVKSFFADPRGKAIGTSAANLGRHFASDVGLARYADQIPSGPPPDEIFAPDLTIYSSASEDTSDYGDCGYAATSLPVQSDSDQGCYATS